jgi:hypothetical protein
VKRRCRRRYVRPAIRPGDRGNRIGIDGDPGPGAPRFFRSGIYRVGVVIPGGRRIFVFVEGGNCLPALQRGSLFIRHSRSVLVVVAFRMAVGPFIRGPTTTRWCFSSTVTSKRESAIIGAPPLARDQGHPVRVCPCSEFLLEAHLGIGLRPASLGNSPAAIVLFLLALEMMLASLRGLARLVPSSTCLTQRGVLYQQTSRMYRRPIPLLAWTRRAFLGHVSSLYWAKRLAAPAWFAHAPLLGAYSAYAAFIHGLDDNQWRPASQSPLTATRPGRRTSPLASQRTGQESMTREGQQTDSSGVCSRRALECSDRGRARDVRPPVSRRGA